MRVFLMICIAFLAIACGKPEPAVVGEWETAVGLAGGALSLREDGTGQMTSMSPITMNIVTKPITWRKDGDQIAITAGSHTDAAMLSPDGQTLTIIGNNNQVVFRRVPDVPAAK